MTESRDLGSYLDEVVNRALADGPVADPAGPGGIAGEAPPVTLKGRARHLLRHVYQPVAREEILRQERTEARMITESARTLAAIAGLEVEIEQLREQIRAEPHASSPAAEASSQEFDDFYLAFENRFRGSDDQITERLTPYLNDLYPLPTKGAPVLDLGCGHGEWLRLLHEHEITAEGVDVNTEFAEKCRADGLSVRVGDAFATLDSATAESYGVITTFQFVEHVGIPKVGDLFREARRVLAPGGIVIAETPNPTNLHVGAASFYRDPTHRRPVHPDLLAFIAEHAGFEVEIRYMNPMDGPAPPVNEMPEWAQGLAGELHWALFGPLDYSVIARKPAG